jgi:hypothetical protein
MDITSDDLSKYITGIPINDAFVSLRNSRYPLTSLPPSGTGRFHRQHQEAYYMASGSPTAAAEVYGDPNATVVPPIVVCGIPTGEYRLLDSISLFEDHPNLRVHFFPQDGDDHGWANCQNLRDRLEALACSGVIYSSYAYSGGINVAVWSLVDTPLTADFFTKREQ